jgi:hypothetical protein
VPELVENKVVYNSLALKSQVGKDLEMHYIVRMLCTKTALEIPKRLTSRFKKRKRGLTRLKLLKAYTHYK